MVAQICLKISANFFAILDYHYGFFKKNIKFTFLVNFHHFLNTMKPGKMKSLSEVENEIEQLQHATLSLDLPFFLRKF